jgi:hypothetical protein
LAVRQNGYFAAGDYEVGFTPHWINWITSHSAGNMALPVIPTHGKSGRILPILRLKGRKTIC